MKKILVTGGRGFIGRHVLEPLIESGYQVHVVSSQPCSIEGKVIYHHSDLLDCSLHAELITTIKPTHLLHLAWYTTHGKFWSAIENIDWMKATVSLAEEFYRIGGCRFVGLGSCAEYAWDDGYCIEGVTAEHPGSVYGKAKQLTYECVQNIAQKYSADFAWTRIFFPYGPGEKNSRFVPYIITQMLEGKPALCTHGTQLRDYMYVTDIADALVSVVDSDFTGAINIASGEAIKLSEVANMIAAKLNRGNLLELGAVPEPVHSPEKIVADVANLKNKILWDTKVPLSEGLSRTIEWWQMNMTQRVEEKVTVDENGN